MQSDWNLTLTKEMKHRERVCLGGSHQHIEYRYRRFQALSDALDIFFVLMDSKGWMSVSDICDELEWDPINPSTRKRVRRILEALNRIHRIDIRRDSTKFFMAKISKVEGARYD